MKTRKIRARRSWHMHGTAYIALTNRGASIPVAVIDVSNEAALIEQVAQEIYASIWGPIGDYLGNPMTEEVKADAKRLLESLGIVRAKRGNK